MENVTAVKITAPVRRYNRIDGWRGYMVPACAIVGASDTGTAPDSPCPTPDVKAELARFGKEVLHPLGIKYRTRDGGSSNVFCGKRWICVNKASFGVAALAALKWLEEHHHDTHYIHDANLKENDHGRS